MLSLKTISAAAMAISLSVGAPINAQDLEGDDQPEINPWKHCGIGAIVFSDEDDETLAAISNIIFDLGTTAVSSKVSSPDTCEGEAIQTASLIQKTYAQLAADTARGDGQYLTATLDLMKCDAAVRPALVADMRVNLADMLSDAAFVDADDTAKAEAFYMALKADVTTSYSASCSIA